MRLGPLDRVFAAVAFPLLDLFLRFVIFCAKFHFLADLFVLVVVSITEIHLFWITVFLEIQSDQHIQGSKLVVVLTGGTQKIFPNLTRADEKSGRAVMWTTGKKSILCQTWLENGHLNKMRVSDSASSHLMHFAFWITLPFCGFSPVGKTLIFGEKVPSKTSFLQLNSLTAVVLILSGL